MSSIGDAGVTFRRGICRVDELFQIKGAHIKYLDEENRVGLIELTMPDSRNKIHTKKMPITTWLFEEMEAEGIFIESSNERLFMWTKAYRKPFDLIKEEARGNPTGRSTRCEQLRQPIRLRAVRN